MCSTPSRAKRDRPQCSCRFRPALHERRPPVTSCHGVIESKIKDFKPEKCAEWLEGHRPQPVTDMAKWRIEED